MSLLYSVLSISLEMTPGGFSSLYNWYFLPSIIAVGIASRGVEKIKQSHSEIPASRWEPLEHYPNPLKNTFISWCVAIWLFLMICLGPLYLWFYTTERHHYNEIVGFVFISLIGIAWVFFLGFHLLYTYRFLVLADQLVEEYS
jgi:hypothetical protein